MSGLIEQLGGYDAAKKFTNGECADGFDVQGLRDALLEHRRANNIFEVGDKVVGGSTDYIFTIVFLYGDEDEDDDDEDVALMCESENYHTHLTIHTMRHAEPEELAVGRRLYRK